MNVTLKKRGALPPVQRLNVWVFNYSYVFHCFVFMIVLLEINAALGDALFNFRNC